MHNQLQDKSIKLQVGGWKIISTINIMIIFLIFGITLETGELKEAMKNVKVKKQRIKPKAAAISASWVLLFQALWLVAYYCLCMPL
jgi:hypothetical protein